jgi:Ca-activated chloride channel family protein
MIARRYALALGGLALALVLCPPGPAQAQKENRPTVTFDELLTLVKFKVDDDKIIDKLKESPPIFVLGADQEEQLRKAGASDRLITAIRKAKPAGKIGEVTDLAIVLDCSGSMSYDTPDGKQKMEAAKEVTIELVKSLPAGLNITFIIYGHESFGKTDERNCQAVRVVRPLSRLNDEGKKELTDFIATLKPVGHTPIALSLEKAGEELAKSKGSCGLVLITDGIETCHRDPAAEAAKLASKLNMSFGVNVIGFGLKPEEKRAVEKIALAGRGKYYDAQSGAELAKQIKLVEEKVAEAAKPAEEKKPAAEEAQASSTGKRAIKILEPDKGIPDMKEVLIVPPSTSRNVLYAYDPIVETRYDKEIRIPNPQKKYDIWWVPKQGQATLMIEGFSLAESKVRDIKPEEHLGMVEVAGEGKGKDDYIYLVPPGTSKNVLGAYYAQMSHKFGERMVVRPGVYDVWANGNLLEEKLKVEAGKLHKIE